jgi:ribosome-binding factor A
MAGPVRRSTRVAEALRDALTRALTRELSDPRLSSLVITEVSVSDDLGVARVGVRKLAGDDAPAARTALLRSLKRARGRLQRAVVPSLDLKKALELRFHYDAGHHAAERVDELLKEIQSERREPEAEPGAKSDPESE